jgi:hypothetical protein
MSSLTDAPCWFWLITLFISGYHAYRGFEIQRIWAIQQNQQLRAEITRRYSGTEIVILRCVEDMLFHLVCSLSGFISLLVAKTLYDSFAQSQTIDTGTSILLIFSFLIGIIGVSGQLPPLIQMGKIPGIKN